MHRQALTPPSPRRPQHQLQGVDEGVHAAPRGHVVGAADGEDGRVRPRRARDLQPDVPARRQPLPAVAEAGAALRLRRPLLHLLQAGGLLRVRGDRRQLRQQPPRA